MKNKQENPQQMLAEATKDAVSKWFDPVFNSIFPDRSKADVMSTALSISINRIGVWEKIDRGTENYAALLRLQALIKDQDSFSAGSDSSELVECLQKLKDLGVKQSLILLVVYSGVMDKIEGAVS